MNKHSPLHTIGLASGCLNSSSSKPIKPRNNHQYNISYQNYHYSHLDHTLLDAGSPSSLNRKSYDFKLKFIIVGDADCGKQEILDGLESDDSQSVESDFTTMSSTPGVNYRSTTILLDGKRIKIQLWDASGQGRFGTIIRSYSRGAQGILLVYDITNKWSFSSLDRWLQEVEEHAPGIPKILIGNRLHLAFKRQVNAYTAENYAQKHSMSFFEISPLCNYNIQESFAELSRIVLKRHGMSNLWKQNSVLSLQELCCRTIMSSHTIYSIENLPIPNSLKSHLLHLSLSSSYQPNKKYIHSYKCGYSRNSGCMESASFKKKAKSLFSSMFKLNG